MSLYAIKTMTKEFISIAWLSLTMIGCCGIFITNNKMSQIYQIKYQIDVHHVRVKILAEQVFLRCDCLLMKGNVKYFIYFLYAIKSLLLLVTHNIYICLCASFSKLIILHLLPFASFISVLLGFEMI
jgi:hypothetical protein